MQTYALDNSLSVDRFCNLQLESWLSSFNRQVRSRKWFVHRLQLAVNAARKFDKVCLRLRTNELVSSNAASAVRRKLFSVWENISHTSILLLILIAVNIILTCILDIFTYIFTYLVNLHQLVAAG